MAKRINEKPLSRTHLFTSESVSMGHPDKICDQISDAILDAMLAGDPFSRVACEAMVTTGLVMVSGEITTRANVDIPELVRRTICEIGYDDSKLGFDGNSCAVLSSIHKQSPDISQGVTAKKTKEQGAGDQGLMFGFACRETPSLMPLPIDIANRLMERLTRVRQSGVLPWLRPDAKSQITVEYQGQIPLRVHTVVLSTQHDPDIAYKKLCREITDKVIMPTLPKSLVKGKPIIHINPTGRFVVGGPHGDTGLTGRKIIVDTYGGRGRHGGGAFSGKDPSKVDRSASYMARYIAKNIVAAQLADICEVQIAYAIGVAQPVSVKVDTEATGRINDDRIADIIRTVFPLTPAGIIRHLKLLRPIYLETARFGHFGRNGSNYTWEKTDKVSQIRRLAGLK